MRPVHSVDGENGPADCESGDRSAIHKPRVPISVAMREEERESERERERGGERELDATRRSSFSCCCCC